MRTSQHLSTILFIKRGRVNIVDAICEKALVKEALLGRIYKNIYIAVQ